MKDLREACVIVQQFAAILNNDLKAVTGSSEMIDRVSDKVTEQVTKLSTFAGDVFMPESQIDWDSTFTSFKQNIENTENDTIQLIENTFKENRLNSSVGAFDLLDNFKESETRPKIKKILNGKYDDVLLQYSKELNEMDSIFKANESNPPIPKNMPKTSGAIAWARSIITRIKTPIDKFRTHPEYLLGKETGR